MKKVISLLIPLIAIPFFIFFANMSHDVKPMPSTDITPVQINVIQNEDQTYTITWRTDAPTVGKIIWGIKSSSLDQLITQEDMSSKVSYHSLIIKSPSNNFYYSIYANDKIFNQRTNTPFSYP